MKTLAREECRAELIRRLRTVRPESTARWGRMSAHQMLCHLSDACRIVTGQRTVRSASNPLRRTVVKWMALYAPLPWPAGIPTLPELDQQRGGTCPADFNGDALEVESLLNRIATLPEETAWPDHPIFGAMSQAAWLRWAYRHADHHLRQFGA